MQVLFRVAPHRTGRARFKGIRLSSDYSVSFCGWLPGVDGVVAVGADHKGLAAPFCHDRRPCRPLRLAELVEVGELSDVVHLNVSRALADLASVRKDSGNQFLAADSSTWLMVLENSLLLASQRYPAVPGDQWLPAAVAFDGRFEAGARPVWGIDFGFIFRRQSSTRSSGAYPRGSSASTSP